MPLEFVGCVGGCDETLREILDLRFSRGPARAGQPVSQPSGHLQASQPLDRMGSSQHGHPQPPATRPSKALARTVPLPAAEGEGNSVTCNCGREALLLTVRKEGPNQGRQFYKCSGGGCSFFLWADSGHPEAGGPPSEVPRPPGGSLGRPPGSGKPLGGPGSPGDGGGGACCLCSQPAVKRTVQKDGPNKGRQFHTCAKPREQQCGFFQWVDENVAPGEGAHGACPRRAGLVGWGHGLPCSPSPLSHASCKVTGSLLCAGRHAVVSVCLLSPSSGGGCDCDSQERRARPRRVAGPVGVTQRRGPGLAPGSACSCSPALLLPL